MARTVNAIPIIENAQAGSSTAAEDHTTHPARSSEVGTSRDRVFAAMELVEGTTLRVWITEQPAICRTIEIPRTTPEVRDGHGRYPAIPLIFQR